MSARSCCCSLWIVVSNSTTEFNPTGLQDPEMDRLWAAAQAATTVDEYQRRVREAEQYIVGGRCEMRNWANHWILWGGRVPHFHASQPWVKGYNGETNLGLGMERTIDVLPALD